jgi:hypothetical protein
MASRASRLRERRAHFGRMHEVKRTLFSAGTSVARSRTFGRCTSSALMPVWMLRSGP